MLTDKRTHKTADNKDGDKTINCPRCSNLFRKQQLRKLGHPAGVVLDVCDKCSGMWVDGNEVKVLFEKTKARRKKENKK